MLQTVSAQGILPHCLYGEPARVEPAQDGIEQLLLGIEAKPIPFSALLNSQDQGVLRNARHSSA